MSRQSGYNPEGLCIAFKSIILPQPFNSSTYYFLSVVAERRVPQVVSKARRFYNIRIQASPSLDLGGIFFQ